MNQTYHHLKLLNEYWDAVKSGRKTFEVRDNDRCFQTGDIVIFHRYSKEAGGSAGNWHYLISETVFTPKREFSEVLTYMITYVLPLSTLGINTSYVVFGIKPTTKEEYVFLQSSVGFDRRI